MLADNGILDGVISVSGQLIIITSEKTVNLSEAVYNQRNAAAAVAAHECGHAVQHAVWDMADDAL
jgi:Zn-dependent membrane protease YugP